jgi:hypothetical protein
MSLLVLLALLLTGCADSFDKQLQQQQANFEQARRVRQADYQQASRARNDAFTRMEARHDETCRKRLADIRQLPLDQQDAALDRLQADEEAWHRAVQAQLDREERDLEREGRNSEREQMLDAQRELTDAINDLSNEIENARVGY